MGLQRSQLVVSPTDPPPMASNSKQTNHSRARLDEPVESKLRSLSDGCAQLIVHVLAVEAELVQHAHEKAVFLLGVILAFVCAVLNPQLVEWSSIPSHLVTTAINN